MKKIILGIIIGGIVFGGSALAYSYTAKQVGFTPNDKNWKVSTVEEAINSLKNSNETTEEKIQAYENKITEYEEKIENYETKISELESNKSANESKITEYEEKIEKCEKKIEEYEKKISELETTTKICELKSGKALTIGSMYECNPGDGIKRNFYVLEVRNNGVDLIMEKNISSGTMNWNNAMKFIESNSLKTNWKDVLDVDLPGTQQIANAVGNSSWKAIDSASTWWCFASKKQDSQSAPYCDTNAAKAYNFLYDYTRACNGCTHTLEDKDGQPYGYWTRDAVNETTTARAWGVSMNGNLNIDDASHASGGVRPVITISKSNIK